MTSPPLSPSHIVTHRRRHFCPSNEHFGSGHPRVIGTSEETGNNNNNKNKASERLRTRAHPADCGPAPAAPCVGGGGHGPPACPPRTPPAPDRRAGREGPEGCPAGTPAEADGSPRLGGVLVPPEEQRDSVDFQKERRKTIADYPLSLTGSHGLKPSKVSRLNGFCQSDQVLLYVTKCRSATCCKLVDCLFSVIHYFKIILIADIS